MTLSERCDQVADLALRLGGQRVDVIEERLPLECQFSGIQHRLYVPTAIAFRSDEELHRVSALHHRVEDLLMEDRDLLSPLEMRSLEGDEVGTLGERGPKASPLPLFQASTSCWGKARMAASSEALVDGR